MHTKLLPLILRAFIAAIIATLSVTPALSQETEQSTVIYDAAYFAQYNPVSLEDMIRNIPGGISLLSSVGGGGQNNRGFGATDSPILIDGRRMSGKSNDMSTTLARIQASHVERIELIRNNAEGLDIRNEGIIYNVVLRAGAERSSSSFLDIGLNYVDGTSVMPEILASHNGQRGVLEYGVSYEYDTRPRVVNVNEDVLRADRTPREFRALVSEVREAGHIVTGNIGYEFENGTLIRLNALYSDSDEPETKLEDQFAVNTGGTNELIAVEDGRFDEATQEMELGGDIEFDVGQIGRLKTLFVLTRTDNHEEITQDSIVNGVADRLFSELAESDEGETIVRSSMASTFGEHTLEYGGEGAFNTLDASFSFDNDPLENAIVEEDRYEVFVTHSISLNDKLSLQSALTGEFSTIFQDRDGETNSRSFQFLKPRFEVRYDKTAVDQYRVLVERTVSQLDLEDFVASRNVADDTINFGNPDLEPESKWIASLGYERRFADDGGSLELELFHEWISNHIDKILIGDEAGSGVGNIGSAERLGFNLNLSTRFGFVGLPSAVLTVSYMYRDSEVTDPFTGEERTTRNETPHFINFNFRHDVEDSKVAYGFNAHRRSGRQRQDVSLREITNFSTHVSIFAEYNFSANMKARAEANHVYGDARSFDKTFYAGHIADDVVRRVDFQDQKSNSDFFFSLQTTF